MIKLDTYRAGKFENHHTGYTYFLPTQINEQWKWEDQTLNLLLEKAAIKLGELNSYAQLVPNINLFIQKLILLKSAMASKAKIFKGQPICGGRFPFSPCASASAHTTTRSL